jgi:hypothetical protein
VCDRLYFLIRMIVNLTILTAPPGSITCPLNKKKWLQMCVCVCFLPPSPTPVKCLGVFLHHSRGSASASITSDGVVHRDHRRVHAGKFPATRPPKSSTKQRSMITCRSSNSLSLHPPRIACSRQTTLWTRSGRRARGRHYTLDIVCE